LLRSLARHTPAVQWLVLLLLSAGCVLALAGLRLPAAMLLGPMIAGIAVALAGTAVEVPGAPFVVAQGVIGLLIARSLSGPILAEVVRDWPVFVAGVTAVVGAAAALGWTLARFRVLPGTTAVWGSAPGASTVMTLMAEAYGADIRLVAFMQYLRVVCVALVASLVAGGWSSAPHAPAIVWFPPIAWPPLVGSVALATIGAGIAVRLRIPAGPMLVPLFAGAFLQATGAMTLELPPWLLAASYALIGWSIGLRFTRPILAHAARALPRVLASIFALIGICGGFAALLWAATDIDPLSAYLATSPGGADSVAIIAASSRANLPFVMAMQTCRFLVVVFTGPGLARFVAGRLAAGKTGVD
jgi:membrane AbrB-like protein